MANALAFAGAGYRSRDDLFETRVLKGGENARHLTPLDRIPVLGCVGWRIEQGNTAAPSEGSTQGVRASYVRDCDLGTFGPEFGCGVDVARDDGDALAGIQKAFEPSPSRDDQFRP